MIRFSTLDVEMPPIEPQRVKAWIEDVAHRYGKAIGELYYYFCSDEKLLEINKERLGHDFYTDIVTFPLTDCEIVLSSEFCISVDRIKENAVTFGRRASLVSRVIRKPSISISESARMTTATGAVSFSCAYSVSSKGSTSC